MPFAKASQSGLQARTVRSSGMPEVMVRGWDRCCRKARGMACRKEPEREKRYRAFLKYGTERDCSDRIIRVRNRWSGEEGREDGREDGGEVGTVRISSARKSGPALITEGRFAKDIHRMAELCYNKS